jgi:hypothetical protein
MKKIRTYVFSDLKYYSICNAYIFNNEKEFISIIYYKQSPKEKNIFRWASFNPKPVGFRSGASTFEFLNEQDIKIIF